MPCKKGKQSQRLEFEGTFYHITSRGNLHKIGDLGSNASHRQVKW
ncbi:MAG: hypothetical protein HKUEN01_12280 [Candidatus Kuenenia stuttgartiensis]|jgi:hypothetical protein|nr:MAG: hypothetical protein HKUEN01_12280 [Candidatus Kuenenia stuttgartiensis]